MPVPTAASASAPLRRTRRGFYFLLFVLLLGSVVVPDVFQTVLRGLIKFTAWRNGATVRIQRIEGSLWEPVVLYHTYWSAQGVAGGTTRVEIARMEAHISWVDFFRRHGDRSFERLVIRGVQGKIALPMDGADSVPARAEGKPFREWLPRFGSLPEPGAIEAQDVEIVFQCDGDYVRVEGASFKASRMESGDIVVERLVIQQPWLRRTFRDVRGQTARSAGRLVLGSVVLEPGVQFRSLVVSPEHLFRGQLSLSVDVDFHAGDLRINSATNLEESGLAFEAGGTFENLDLAKLAAFLGLADAVGGVITQGTFSFRGPPHAWQRAQASVRFEAVNFQWDSRQWDSFKLGVMLMNRRVKVPQFHLRQGENELQLNGELELPGSQQNWWQGDFHTTVNAQIGNLTELSALLLPEFKYAAGKATVEGTVRGRGEVFDGQLLVAGENLTWRNAPIETLHAAIKLKGREFEIARVEMTNGDDYLRGRGLVRMVKPTVYSGDLRIAVEDLASYAAFLQKPVLPEPLAGGAIIDWSGKGSAEGHEGRVAARLRKVRPLGAMAQRLHPIDAEMVAAYAPGSIAFERFRLGDDDSVFTANVAVGNQALHVLNLRFLHRGKLQLEGDALLPLDVWQKWPNVSLDQLLTEEVVGRVQLKARQLDLAEAASLTGWKFPIAGVVDGDLNADGAITSLQLTGSLKITNGRLPLGWTGDVVEDFKTELGFSGNEVRLIDFTGRHRFGALQIGGRIILDTVLDPNLDLAVTSPRFAVPLFSSGEGAPVRPSTAMALDFQVSGPVSSATVRGAVTLREIALGGELDLSNILAGKEVMRIPSLFSFPEKPWCDWVFAIAGRTAEQIQFSDQAGTLQVDVRVDGSGRDPRLSGFVEARDLGAVAGQPVTLPLRIPMVRADFFRELPESPSIDLTALGVLDGEAFSIGVAGPLSHLMRVFHAPPPLTARAVQERIAPRHEEPMPIFLFEPGISIHLEIYPPAAAEAGLLPPGRKPVTLGGGEIQVDAALNKP